jgi:hypothetical protein
MEILLSGLQVRVTGSFLNRVDIQTSPSANLPVGFFVA